MESRINGGEAQPAARVTERRDGTLANAAYRRLRHDILAGVLAPGQRLRLHDLRTRYAIGVAPLREALSRLQAEELVVATDHRGAAVAGVSIAEMLDLTRVRIVIDDAALREAIAQGDDAWEAGLVAAFHRLDRASGRLASGTDGAAEEWEARHEEFHRALLAAAPSPMLLRLHGMLLARWRRYRLFSIYRQAGRDHVGEHRAIMEAALARDAETACRRLAEHYRLTGDVTRRALESSSLQTPSEADAA
ncbi:FCD domain-containing protein [Falsiroseomonas sp.]|uniref:FCD domain-containing protein n=1 Tax=Falsiroseomonas sp. TaxID=2870721 RepID=UPI003566EC94